MSIGIMQPYLFPYIGYFQLIDSVDIFVNLNHVSFMKRSYMVRNYLKNEVPINISVINGSQNKTCVETEVISDKKWFKTFNTKLETLYRKEKNFEEINHKIINPIQERFEDKKGITISEFNVESIKIICSYLNIDTKFEDSIGKTSKKREDGLIEISRKFNQTDYINAIGGQKLYDKNYFKNEGINLNFIKMGNIDLENKNLSILDIIFCNDKDRIMNELKKYELI